jgi:hypothetical protein
MSYPSYAAQVIVSIIPIVGIVMGAIVVFFYLLWSYKAKRHLIERGLYEAKAFDPRSFCLLAGLVLTMVGAMLFILFLLLDGISYNLLGGAIPLSIGVALLVFYKLQAKPEA